jgi:hypothetical protein
MHCRLEGCQDYPKYVGTKFNTVLLYFMLYYVLCRAYCNKFFRRYTVKIHHKPRDILYVLFRITEGETTRFIPQT